MSEVAALIADLAKAGLAPDLIGRVAQAIADAAGSRAAEPPKRSAAAERTARWREKKAAEAAASVTRDVTVTRHEPSPRDVTDHHEASRRDALARVRDNLPRLVISGLIDDDDCASAQDRHDDWPRTNVVEALVDEIASPRLDHRKSPGLVQTSGQLAAWKRDGASWEHDVLPVVKALCAKTKSPIASWKFFAPAIAQSIADNRAALAIPEARQATGPPVVSITDRIAAENEAVRRRTDEILAQRAARNG